jgi:hypothetical protein
VKRAAAGTFGGAVHLTATGCPLYSHFDSSIHLHHLIHFDYNIWIDGWVSGFLRGLVARCYAVFAFE